MRLLLALLALLATPPRAVLLASCAGAPCADVQLPRPPVLPIFLPLVGSAP